MSSDFHGIILAIAGPLTQRTLENLRRTLEELWIKSTGQDGDPASFTPELIAQAHEAAKQDNAKIIVSWAQAIYDESKRANDPFLTLQRRLLYARDAEAFFARDLADLKEGRGYPSLSVEERERAATATERALHRAQEEILGLEKDLRDLSQSAPSVLGRAPQAWKTGTTSVGHYDLDGLLQAMSSKDP